jgi:hypothetical protein
MSDQQNLLGLMHFDGPGILNDAEPISQIDIIELEQASLSNEKVKFGVSSFKPTGDGYGYCYFNGDKLPENFLQTVFTVDFWIYVPSGEDYRGAEFYFSEMETSIGLSNIVYVCFEYRSWIPDWTIKLYLYSNKTSSPTYSLINDQIYIFPSMTVDSWHHIAIVKRSNAYFRVYWDGVLVLTSTNQWPFPYTTSASRIIDVGAYSDGDVVYLDEFRWIKEELWTGTSFDVPIGPMILQKSSISDILLSFNSIYLSAYLELKNNLQELRSKTDVFDLKTSILFYQANKNVFKIENSYVQNLQDNLYVQNQFTQQVKSMTQLKNAVGFSPISGNFMFKNSIDSASPILFDQYIFDETYLGV